MASIFVMNSTYRFQLTITKDGSAWDLSGATVAFHLRNPSGTIANYTATVTDGPGGVARYDSVIANLNSAGLWARSWTVTDGSTICETLPVSFYVNQDL